MKNVIIILLFVATISVSAQEKISSKSAKDTIFTIETFNGDYYYIADKECSTNKITSLLGDYKETRELLYSSNSKSKWGYVTAWGGVAIGAYWLYQGINYYNNHGSSPYSSDIYGIKDEFLFATAVVIGCEITALILFYQSDKDFREAIKVYNQKLLSSDSGFDFRFNITSLSFSYKF